MKELWKDINDYEGLYQVSNLGNVRNIKTGRVLKPGKCIEGYLLVVLCKNSKPKTFRIHRLVAEAFIPNPDKLLCVNHKDENPSNNLVILNEDGSIDEEKSNLEWCSYEYNNNYGTRNVAEVNTIQPTAISGVTQIINNKYIHENEVRSKTENRPMYQFKC